MQAPITTNADAPRTAQMEAISKGKMMAQLEVVTIPAAHGTLEGLLRVADEEASASGMVAVVCHPHPLGGGTLHNKVVATLAKALNAAGIPALRFNFRGVGRSTGSYDAGRGEGEDLLAALDWLAVRYPKRPISLAGFSFGSWVGLPIGAADDRITQLIGVGIPFRMLTIEALSDCAKPKLIVQGSQDEYGPLEALQPWFEHLTPPKTLHIIAGADHFLNGHLDELSPVVTGWLRNQDPAARA